MKITTFNPQIVTKDPESVTKLFEELGFEKRHTKEEIGKLNATAYRMKDANGFYIDIAKASLQLPQDIVTIRINVDDFDEAYKMFREHGFKNALGDDRIAETGSSRNAVMSSPSGFKVTLIQHIK
jgi:adenylate cyclase class IV